MSQDDHSPIFDEHDARTLTAVLDEIIPPRPGDRLPGAGELGLVAHIESAVREGPDLLAALTPGLAALVESARGRGAASFAELSAQDRHAVLEEVAAAQPAFLPGLIFHSYVGYYQHPRVLEALGLEARPPHPLGYELEPGDLSRLDAVRQRGKFYREVSS